VTIKNIIYKSDCLHFRGDIPCKPHKEYDVKCENCSYYAKTNKRILIVKLGAIGDVIRTTPLLEKINQEYPNSDIWWLTQYPDILPRTINKILPFTTESIVLIENTEFDIVYGLDKDLPAVAVTKKVIAKEKFGFTLLDGKPSPINELAKAIKVIDDPKYESLVILAVLLKNQKKSLPIWKIRQTIKNTLATSWRESPNKEKEVAVSLESLNLDAST
jgi:hypothetical protein